MKSVILENVGQETPIIFFGDDSWQRINETHSKAAWRARASDHPLAPDQKLAGLLEHITQHPEEVQTIDTLALDDEDTAAAQWVVDRVAKLDAAIVRAIARQHEDKLVCGRALNEQKRILPHGTFKLHVSETLGSVISLRTAERYMKLAREEDAKSKVDTLSLLNSASDDVAQNTKAATKRAQEEQTAQTSVTKSRKKDALYELPLALNSDDRKAVDTLRLSSDWPEVEQNIIAELRRLCIEYGITREQDHETDHEDDYAGA